MNDGDGFHGYRSHNCHQCRCDFDRLKKAELYDEKQTIHVQELVCKKCNTRYKWWYFAKLPLNKEEEITLMQKRKGKAW